VSTRAHLAIAGVVALASAIGIGIIVAGWLSNDSRAPAPLDLRETAAVAPFVGYRETRIATRKSCVRVVVADTEARRGEGLRGVRDPGPYLGMLFVQPAAADIPFTMAGVRDPLDVVWFADDGSRVGSARMRPCPVRAAAHCPVYRSPRSYRYALETPLDTPAPPQLAPC
jgi:uncharacterized membrane protein (UPF0127 family)